MIKNKSFIAAWKTNRFHRSLSKVENGESFEMASFGNRFDDKLGIRGLAQRLSPSVVALRAIQASSYLREFPVKQERSSARCLPQSNGFIRICRRLLSGRS